MFSFCFDYFIYIVISNVFFIHQQTVAGIPNGKADTAFAEDGKELAFANDIRNILVKNAPKLVDTVNKTQVFEVGISFVQVVMKRNN